MALVLVFGGRSVCVSLGSGVRFNSRLVKRERLSGQSRNPIFQLRDSCDSSAFFSIL